MILEELMYIFFSRDNGESPYLLEVDAEIFKDEMVNCWD